MARKNVVEQLRHVIMGSLTQRAEIARKAEIGASVLTHFVNDEKDVCLSNFAKLCRVMKLELRPIDSPPGAPKTKTQDS